MTAAATLVVGVLLVLRAPIEDAGPSAGPGATALTWALLAVAIAAPLGVAWVVLRWPRTRTGSVAPLLHGVSLGVAVAALSLAGVNPVLAGAAALTGWALLMAAVYAGVGGVLGWAIRFAWRQLSAIGDTLGRTLPLLLLILVVFFTGELWQWAASVTRLQVWSTVGLLAVIGVVFMATSLRDEVNAVERHRLGEHAGARLADTPFQGHSVPRDSRAPLERRERLSVLGKLLIAQLIQVLLIAVLVMAFFVALASVMLPDAVIESWSGQPPGTGSLFGVDLPIPQATLHMSLLMAALSGLYIAVNSSIDDRYRSAFFTPLIDEVAVTLAARDAYTAHRDPLRTGGR